MTSSGKRNQRGGFEKGPRRGKPVQSQERRLPGRRSAPTVEKRSAGAKVSAAAARALRSGHPWVFRDALGRSHVEHAPGAILPVVDYEGYRLGWGMFDPEGTVALRMLSSEANFQWDKPTMAERLRRAVAYRTEELGDSVQSACRLVHGEADGFPGLAVDRLGDFLLIYKYARCAEGYLEQFIEVLAEEVPTQGIYMQDRVRPVQSSERRPPAFHMWGKTAPAEYEVEEDGLKFVVDVTAPVSPGLFLDLREGRRAFEERAKGQRVLNLFSFTGAFGVRAVRAGAKTVTQVDAAARSHARCRQNLSASGMDPEACRALSGDVFKFLERFRDRQEQFDLVVVDPPPFSNVDGAVFSALRDWSRLIEAVAQVMAPKGEIFAICNAAGLSEQEFLNAVGEGANRAKRSMVMIGEWGLPADFPVLPAFQEGRYLKARLFKLGE